jgi:hypothetical protein
MCAIMFRLPCAALICREREAKRARSPAEAAASIRGTAVELNDAKGKITALERQLGPKGVLPPCWSDKAQRIEYVFDVTLTSTGLRPVLRDLPDRRDQLIELLGSSTMSTDEIADARFLGITKKMFDWSVAHSCRFYVMVYDARAAHEKDIYKRRLKTVEGHFYKTLAENARAQ